MFGGALGESDLWTVSPSGGFPRSMHIDMGDIAFLQTHQAAYSPDGKWVSYISTRTGPAEMYLRSLQDGRETQLTNLGARINSYSWSPDGQQIALAGDKFGELRHLRRADVRTRRGHARDRPARSTTCFPSWTPDSKHVVFVQLDDRWADHDGATSSIRRWPSIPRAVVKDTGFFDYAEGGGFGYPAISPDGSALLFRSQRSGWVNYWSVPMSGGAPRADRAGGRQSERRALVAGRQVDPVRGAVERDAGSPCRERRGRRATGRGQARGHGSHQQRRLVARRCAHQLHARDADIGCRSVRRRGGGRRASATHHLRGTAIHRPALIRSEEGHVQVAGWV